MAKDPQTEAVIELVSQWLPAMKPYLDERRPIAAGTLQSGAPIVTIMRKDGACRTFSHWEMNNPVQVDDVRAIMLGWASLPTLNIQVGE